MDTDNINWLYYYILLLSYVIYSLRRPTCLVSVLKNKCVYRAHTFCCIYAYLKIECSLRPSGFSSQSKILPIFSIFI